MRWWWRILTCFLWEHALFLVCLAIYRLVPSSPQWVRTANARIRYQLAQAARVCRPSRRRRWREARPRSTMRSTHEVGSVWRSEKRAAFGYDCKSPPERLQIKAVQLQTAICFYFIICTLYGYTI